jgi:hypothetical protein
VRIPGAQDALSRGNGRMRLFHTDEDFAAFGRVLAEGPFVSRSVFLFSETGGWK